jgi:hypothetical protein
MLMQENAENLEAGDVTMHEGHGAMCEFSLSMDLTR